MQAFASFASTWGRSGWRWSRKPLVTSCSFACGQWARASATKSVRPSATITFLFASREPGTGGQYHAVEADTRRDLREPFPEDASSNELPGVRTPTKRPSRRPPSSKPSSRPSNRPSRLPEGVSADNIPPNRLPAESRYAPARSAVVFGKTERPPPPSLSPPEIASDKSLDEVILSFLAEDLEGPRK